MTRAKIWQGILGVCFVVILGLVAMTVVNGQYLEAIAISSIGSVFIWFTLGAGK